MNKIDVQASMKQRIGAAMPRYLILGACKPQMALTATELEPKVGAMLPCDVILRQVGESIEISAVDAWASMVEIQNPSSLKSPERCAIFRIWRFGNT